MKTTSTQSSNAKTDEKEKANSSMSGGTLHMQPLRSAEEAVTEALRIAIHNGDLKPGQRLSQADLAEQLGVSRIPLRDALRRLEAEALVKMDGRRGTWVSALSIESVKEIYEIRIMLEERCARHAVENMSDDDMTRVLALFDEMDRAEADPEGNGFDARRSFYAEFYECARRPMMRDQILLMRDNVGRYHRFKDHSHAHHDHAEFRDAIVKRDGKRASRVLKRHLEDARDDLLSDMEARLNNED
jgi:DNA-binding GntR family transcriptional regulator